MDRTDVDAESTVVRLGHVAEMQVRRILDEGTSANTRRAYLSDLRYFSAWFMATYGVHLAKLPVPTTAVMTFIAAHIEGLAPDVEQVLVSQKIKAAEGRHSIATVRRRVSTLSMAHQLNGFGPLDNPCLAPEVTLLLSKAQHVVAAQGQFPRKVRAATRELIEAMLVGCNDSIVGKRDAALILFAFASGGRRRSEVAAARFEDLNRAPGGYVYHLRKSKTDQRGRGMTIPVMGKAAVAMEAWLNASGISSGALFRAINKGGGVGDCISDKTVARIVKKCAARAGLNPEEFAGHSLRSGFVTEAGRQRVSLGDVMALSGHRSVDVAMRYYQAGSAINNPASRLLEY